ncbi:MAG: homoserine dehydrogenase [Candidatus Dormibacteraceae bacterium]
MHPEPRSGAHSEADGDLVIGMLGLGTVGAQVAARLLERGSHPRSPAVLTLARALVQEPDKPRGLAIPAGLLTTDPGDVIDDDAVDVVVEVMGGEEPALSYIERSIRAGKHVVTANKLVMARHGPRLLELAGEMNVDVYLEAAVGGGIPLISTFKTDLRANDIERIAAVINGTSNYVLGRIAAGHELAAAVAEAQSAGYAEADPSDDVDGRDAVYKLAIMASIAFGTRVDPDRVFREGIQGVAPVDFRYARELGFEIKLLAVASRQGDRVEARVHPAMIPATHPLAGVEGAFNAVHIEGDLVGPVLLWGRGAGGGPTASAVLGDLLDLAESRRRGVRRRSALRFEGEAGLVPMEEIVTRAYYRIRVADRPGVLAAVGAVFAREQVSISSAIQKEAFAAEGAAEFVVTTHPAPESALRRARQGIGRLEPVRAVSSFLRVL